jgi:hypothetical protein
VGGPNSDEGTDTVVLKVYMYFVHYTVHQNSKLRGTISNTMVPFLRLFSPALKGDL